MKRNTAFIFLVLVAGGTGYLFLTSDRTVENEPEAQTVLPSRDAAPVQATREHEASEHKKRIAAMRTAYAELEQARATVRRRLGILNSKLWKLQVPPDQARAITEQMQQGHALLKNPPLLGAFHGVDDIRRELARVNSIAAKLSALEGTVQEYIDAREAL